MAPSSPGTKACGTITDTNCTLVTITLSGYGWTTAATATGVYDAFTFDCTPEVKPPLAVREREYHPMVPFLSKAPSPSAARPIKAVARSHC